MSPADVGEFRSWVRSASADAVEPLCACPEPDGWVLIRLDPLALMRRGLGMRTDVVGQIAPDATLDEARRAVGGILARGARCSTN